MVTSSISHPSLDHRLSTLLVKKPFMMENAKLIPTFTQKLSDVRLCKAIGKKKKVAAACHLE
jgi:hypothetical protein